MLGHFINILVDNHPHVEEGCANLTGGNITACCAVRQNSLILTLKSQLK